ncbi:DUF6705 family protein [Chryseobacterium sp. OV279]|uniref:DUF6705 family protein n=1 Tax=Chryseobacterium sp. OV279 TaxID=1500285 RepID=UPI00091BF42E|nr:DUF6705 family protein [Chryseobacterium sp. OV279]SHF89595.1 hypothetical protein SAMN02787100_2909 [Chryseobacterium sp. OV279]
MKKFLFTIMIGLSTVLNAQLASLELMVECTVNPQNCPENVEYVKDFNHLLDKYVGTWSGNMEGKSYEFNFIKKEMMENEFSTTKWDRLVGRVKIINQNGSIEYNDFSKSDQEANWGDNFQKDMKAYLVTFYGGKTGCTDNGYLYLRVKADTPNQMSITFIPVRDMVTQECSNFQTTIPTGKVIHLTKQ